MENQRGVSAENQGGGLTVEPILLGSVEDLLLARRQVVHDDQLERAARLVGTTAQIHGTIGPARTRARTNAHETRRGNVQRR